MEERCLLATFTVNSTANLNDADTSDQLCDADLGIAGEQCSLRAAIQQANASLNTDNDGDTVVDPDVVACDIPGASVQTIQPSSILPTMSDPVIIDGYTQGSATADPSDDAKPNTLEIGNNAVLQIEINGSAVNDRGLEIVADGSTVRGLVINRFGSSGIVLNSSDNVVAGNFISGNIGEGIFDRGTGTVIQGNFVGTDVTGTIDLANTGIGIDTSAAATVGGTTPGARNVISGNNGHGLQLNGNSAPIVVAGNFIGTQIDGTSPLWPAELSSLERRCKHRDRLDGFRPPQQHAADELPASVLY